MKTIIETERLFLRDVEANDRSFIYELMNTPTWHQFIGDWNIHSLEVAENYIHSSIRKAYQDFGFGMYKILSKESGLPLGLCGLLQRDYLESVDIGFAILPQFEGKGFTYESARAIMDFGFATLKKDVILGITTEENIKSRKLLEKLGMQHIGRVKSSPNAEEIMLYSSK